MTQLNPIVTFKASNLNFGIPLPFKEQLYYFCLNLRYIINWNTLSPINLKPSAWSLTTIPFSGLGCVPDRIKLIWGICLCGMRFSTKWPDMCSNYIRIHVSSSNKVLHQDLPKCHPSLYDTHSLILYKYIRLYKVRPIYMPPCPKVIGLLGR